MSEPHNLQVALALARQGLAVFPVQSGGEKVKQPFRFFQWRDRSTSDEATIRAYWRDHPTAMPALDVGKSGLLVVDADRHDVEHDGVETWGEIMAAHGFEPNGVPIVATPNQGCHFIFRQDGRFGNTKGALPKGIDVRGAGGYVVAPGAVMEDGRAYELDGDLASAPIVPDWLAEMVAKRSSTPAPIPSAGTRDFRVTAPSDTGLEEIGALLSHIPADCGYDEWVQALMAVHAATGGSSTGEALADHWSSGGSKYKPGEVPRKWRSFKSAGVNGATLAALAAQYGADLSATRIAHMPPIERDLEAERIGNAFVQHVVDQRARERERDQAQQRSAMVSQLEWFDDIQPTIRSPYLIKGVLDRGAASVVYGASNCGKTFFVLDAAFHVAIGAPWRGHRVQAGGVLYLAAEGGYGIANRIAALREAFGVVDVPFALRRAGLDLLDPKADTRHVISLAEEVSRRAPISLIVVDTLSRVMAGGDENAPQDMTAFVRNIDTIKEATKAHMLIVHHSGKEAARGARGHSSLRAAVDTEIEVAINDADERFAHVHKQRDLPSGQDFFFSLRPFHLGFDQDGDDVTTCVVEAKERREEGAASWVPERAKCLAILDDIQTEWNAGKPYSMTAQSKRTGRYAPRALGAKFGIRPDAMERLLQAWTDNAVIMSSKFDKSNNRSGLTVIGGI